MAIQRVPVMPVRVNPNPKGSATTHVVMPAANPFERETLQVRSANQPASAMPGMGDFDFGEGGSGFDFDASTFQAPSATSTVKAPTSGGGGLMSWAGGLLKDLTGAAIDVGKTAAVNELSKPKDQNLPSTGAQGLLALAAQNLASKRAKQLPSAGVQPMPVGYPAPSGMAKYTPWIIGAVAVAAVGGFVMLRSGKPTRKYRRRRRR